VNDGLSKRCAVKGVRKKKGKKLRRDRCFKLVGLTIRPALKPCIRPSSINAAKKEGEKEEERRLGSSQRKTGGIGLAVQGDGEPTRVRLVVSARPRKKERREEGRGKRAKKKLVESFVTPLNEREYFPARLTSLAFVCLFRDRGGERRGGEGGRKKRRRTSGKLEIQGRVSS